MFHKKILNLEIWLPFMIAQKKKKKKKKGLLLDQLCVICEILKLLHSEFQSLHKICHLVPCSKFLLQTVINWVSLQIAQNKLHAMLEAPLQNSVSILVCKIQKTK